MFAFTPFAAPQFADRHVFYPSHSLARSCYNHDSTGFSRIAHHPGRAANYHPPFEDVYIGNSLATLPVYESQHSGHPSRFHDILLLQALAREEARRRIVVDRQRRIEHARAQALVREREEYIHRARARQQAEELSGLIDFLSSFVEQAASASPVGVSILLISSKNASPLTPPSLQTSNHASPSKPSTDELLSKEVNTPNEFRFHAPVETLAPYSTPPSSSTYDRKGKARETPAIPLSEFSQAVPGPKPPTTSTSSVLRERQATETDPDVKDVLDSLLNIISGPLSSENTFQGQDSSPIKNVRESYCLIFDPILTNTIYSRLWNLPPLTPQPERLK